MTKLPTIVDIYRAHKRIRPLAWKTPLVSSPELARQTRAEGVFLKLDNLQNSGSFKLRGATNKLLSLSQEDQEKGVITFSTGNHGKAVAYVAGKIGIKAVVCLSEHVAGWRAGLIRDLGAEVSVRGHSQDEAEENYHQLKEEQGYIPVVPFDDPMIIAGQGTLFVEIMEELPDVDVLIVQVSGGGLAAGVALAAKSINPGIHVVGISLERSPAMLESLRAGRPVAVEEKDSIADSLLGGIGVENHYTLPLLEQHVDSHVLISEEEIKQGIYYAFDVHKMIVEGAAAVGIAAMLSGKIDVKGKKAVTLLTGCGIDTAKALNIITELVQCKT